MSVCLRRREFIAGLGGAAAWPLAAWAQQGERPRRIGVLLGGATESDPTYQAWIAEFRDALAKLGWIEGRNLEIDLRRVPNDTNRIRAQAVEILKLMPDAIFAASGAATLAAHLETQTIPIVAICGDAILSALARSIARPEGNVTGFAILYPSIAGKWVQLLKEVQPHLARVAFVTNPETEAGARNTLAGAVNSVYRGPIQAALPIRRVSMTRTSRAAVREESVTAPAQDHFWCRRGRLSAVCARGAGRP